MSTIDTISDLLNFSGSQFRVFDIGRRIDKISKTDFEKIETCQLPYPFPIQGHAHIAIAFWQKSSKTPYLWFIKLPLDERGLLNQGARNHFIAIIVEALGNDLTVDPTEQQEELLKSNPYHFTPAQYKLASLNAKLTVELKQKASSYYEHAQHYFSGNLGWDDWQSLGVQGIADFAARLSNNENEQALINALAHIPLQVFSVLASALENEALSAKMIERLIKRYHSAQTPDEKQQALRALASNCQHPHVVALIASLLSAENRAQSQVLLPADLLIIISGRCWQALAQGDMMMLYLEQLAKLNDTNLFSAIFKDMVSIPLLRHIVLAAIRSENRSEQLAKAIGQLFNQAGSH
ncbi:DUF3549 family protein [Thalassotalea sp. LPB0316]|uniref:DUF3549 family protein n=1 Tax=Thalassotalea sp. LPB0316 TaxID=2769490 RepID=UPI001868BBCB|nr:DUF3549 family protein [Thalassotalea sp. LPB0316]QOL25123.1 DUF3549 family protein [Thalassotalea sp. LPB0316]